MATGWKPYDAAKLASLGYGLPNVITNVELEQMAPRANHAAIGWKAGKRVLFVAVRRLSRAGPSGLLFLGLLHDHAEADWNTSASRTRKPKSSSSTATWLPRDLTKSITGRFRTIR